MTLNIRLSMVGAKERVRDSKQPVHSWNDRYTTDGLGAWRNCSAIAAPIQGGSAMADAVAVQNLMKPRRLIPCKRSDSPTVSCSSKRDMASFPSWWRSYRRDLRAQRVCAGSDLIGRAREDLRHTAHFDQFGDEFPLLIKMLYPPNSRDVRFTHLRQSFRVDSGLHFTFPEHPLKLCAIQRTHRQAAQINRTRGFALDKSLEQRDQFGENRRDATAQSADCGRCFDPCRGLDANRDFGESTHVRFQRCSIAR